MSASTLPSGWQSATLGQIAVITMGQSPPSVTYNTHGAGLPFLQGKADFTAVFPRPQVYCTEPQKVAREGAVLISVRAPVGDVNLADRRYAIGRGLAALDL